jgi:hypothetical protein
VNLLGHRETVVYGDIECLIDAQNAKSCSISFNHLTFHRHPNSTWGFVVKEFNSQLWAGNRCGEIVFRRVIFGPGRVIAKTDCVDIAFARCILPESLCLQRLLDVKHFRHSCIFTMHHCDVEFFTSECFDKCDRDCLRFLDLGLSQASDNDVDSEWEWKTESSAEIWSMVF